MSGQFVPVLEVKKMLCFKIIGLSLPAGIFLEWVGNIFFFYIFMMLIKISQLGYSVTSQLSSEKR